MLDPLRRIRRETTTEVGQRLDVLRSAPVGMRTAVELEHLGRARREQLDLEDQGAHDIRADDVEESSVSSIRSPPLRA